MKHFTAFNLNKSVAILSSSSRLMFFMTLILTLTIPVSILTAIASPFDTYEELYDQFREIRVDKSHHAAVSDLIIKRDVAEFHLEEGDLYLLTPVGGRCVGACFTGKGSVRMEPPLVGEREQLLRFTGAETLDESFKSLLLIFADSTLKELERELSFTPIEGSKASASIQFPGFDMINHHKSRYLNTHLAQALLNDIENELFFAMFKPKGEKVRLFKIDPYEREEVSLSQAPGYPILHIHPDVICQFDWQQDFQTAVASPGESDKNLFRITDYRIDSHINEFLYFTASAELTITDLQPEQKWICLQLNDTLSVTDVVWDQQSHATFHKYQKNSDLWIKTTPAAVEGGSSLSRQLTIQYQGKLLEINRLGWISVRSSYDWIPRYGIREKADFELTFHYPSSHSITSVGERISNRTEDDVTVSTWKTKAPVRNAAFTIGSYNEYLIEDERIPTLIIQESEYGHTDIAHTLIESGITSTSNSYEVIGYDVANSLLFLTDLLGEIDLDTLYVSEIPYLHAEAFTGTIQLPWTTFQRNSPKGLDQILRAHETSHQWWGIGVDFETYHDQWLSEAFAEYSGWWFLQWSEGDNELMFGHLEDTALEIFKNRKYALGDGVEAGPISLGYRTHSTETGGDFNLIVYKKGAWVLHMIRNMMLDLQTMSDERFRLMLRDFYQTYRGKKATTADFQRVVEEHMGMDMTWFFQQWIYGTELPDIYWSWKATSQPGGTWLLHCQVFQRGVADDFRTYPDLYIDFGKGRNLRYRIRAMGLFSEIEIPQLPLKPKKVRFNDLYSVLCESRKTYFSDGSYTAPIEEPSLD